jgi:hypothetical protein
VAGTGRLGRRGPEAYKPKNFTLPDSQIRWLHRVQAAALNEDIKLFESTVAREAFERLIKVGGWPDLKAALVNRARREPQPGRPKAS